MLKQPSLDKTQFQSQVLASHELGLQPARERTHEANSVLFRVPADHPFAQKYGPVFLACGGEHVVYRGQLIPELVLKVDVGSLEQALNSEAKRVGGRQYDLASDAERKQARFAKLAEYFGNSHTLEQRSTVQEFPIIEGIAFELRQDYEGSSLPSSLPALITEQTYSSAPSNQLRLTLVAGYCERNQQITAIEYSQLTEALLWGNALTRVEVNKLFVNIQLNRELKELIAQADDDVLLKNCLCDCLQRACRYTNATGETLDLAGRDNLLFFPQGNSWNYLLVDALYPGRGGLMGKTFEILSKVAVGQDLSPGDGNILMNALNYVRTINGLCLYFDLDGRITVPNLPKNSAAPDLLQIIRGELRD